MGLVNRIAATMIARMSKEDRQQFVEDMTEKFFADMVPEDKQKIINNMMDKFFTSMTNEDKQKIVETIMPKIMKGFNMTVIMPQMMMAMMGLGQQKGGVSGMMPMMSSVTGDTKEANKTENPCMPGLKASENLRPWESCPCRNLCEDDFKRRPKGGEK